jgi:hypothetical protein
MPTLISPAVVSPLLCSLIAAIPARARRRYQGCSGGVA